MRRWLVMAALATACGGEAPAESAPTAIAPATTTASSTTAASETVEAAPEGDVADCERVGPCAEAFAAVVPAELGVPAHVAAQQLDESLAESPARAAACTAALASFRADLARLELSVPEACAIRTSAPD